MGFEDRCDEAGASEVLIAKQKAIRKAAKQKAGREKDTVQLYERFAQVLRS